MRVVVVGDSGVGKTSLTWLLAHEAALPSPAWTIGCSVEVVVEMEMLLKVVLKVVLSLS